MNKYCQNILCIKCESIKTNDKYIPEWTKEDEQYLLDASKWDLHKTGILRHVERKRMIFLKAQKKVCTGPIIQRECINCGYVWDERPMDYNITKEGEK